MTNIKVHKINHFKDRILDMDLMNNMDNREIKIWITLGLIININKIWIWGNLDLMNSIIINRINNILLNNLALRNRNMITLLIKHLLELIMQLNLTSNKGSRVYLEIIHNTTPARTIRFIKIINSTNSIKLLTITQIKIMEVLIKIILEGNQIKAFNQNTMNQILISSNQKEETITLKLISYKIIMMPNHRNHRKLKAILVIKILNKVSYFKLLNLFLFNCTNNNKLYSFFSFM